MIRKTLRCFFLLCSLLPLLLVAQSHAGPDKALCLTGTATLGASSACAECCYLWSPATGLDDPSKPNPVVSGLSHSVLYSVTVSFPDGHFESDDVRVTVYDADIDMYEPGYVHPNQLIPEEMEQLPGAQTFVNKDNDDCDAFFDWEDDEITNGDNEFIKLKITVRIPEFQRPGKEKEGNSDPENLNPYYAVVDAIPGTIVEGVRFWKSNDKTAGEYFNGEQLELTPGVADQYEAFLWVEGVSGHTTQQQLKLYAKLADDLAPGCTQQYVSVTVVDVQEMRWVGIKNGYTGDGKNDSDVLDLDPNNIENGGFRVFAEHKKTGKDSIRNRVILKIMLSVSPPVNQPIYIRPFDLDDPIDELNFIDPNDNASNGLYAGGTGCTFNFHEDNRGYVDISSLEGGFGYQNINNRKEGFFGGAALVNPSSSIYILSNIKIKDIVAYFYVSSFCGDNYRVIVSNDSLFVRGSRNFDRYDKDKITHSCQGDLIVDCPPVPSNLCSPPLSVWRTLHVEYDIMKNPTWEENAIFRGYFKSFDGDFNKAISIRKAFCGPCIDSLVTPIAPFSDNSTGMVAGKKPKGRFQGGGFAFGNPYIELGLPNINGIGESSVIESATGHILKFNDTIDLTLNGTVEGEVKYLGLPNILFKIKNIRKLESFFQINYSDDVNITNEYIGGEIKLIGGPFVVNSIISIDNTTKIITIPDSCLIIPFEVRDDDDIPYNQVSTSLNRVSLNLADSIFQECYINIVSDGAGNINNNQDVLFVRNLRLDNIPNNFEPKNIFAFNNDFNLRQTAGFANENFWIIYLLSGWQSFCAVDGDPNEEGGLGAVAYGGDVSDCDVKNGSDFILINHAVYDEIKAKYPSTSIEWILSHEIGHCLGLSHGDIKSTSEPNPCFGLSGYLLPANVSPFSLMELMAAGAHSNQSRKIIPYQQNLIRQKRSNPKYITP